MKRSSKDKSRRMRPEDGPTWTPTEAYRRDQLMHQFMKGEVSLGKSEAYRQGYDAIDWGDPQSRALTFGDDLSASPPSGRLLDAKAVDLANQPPKADEEFSWDDVAGIARKIRSGL